MSQFDLKIKVSVDAQIQQLRQMEQEMQRNIVRMRALGDTGSESLKTLERNLGSVRRQLGNIGGLEKLRSSLGDAVKDIPVVGVAMNSLNGSALPTAAAFGAAGYAVAQFRASLAFADQLQDAAEQMDISASSLQTLNAHFGDAGVRAEQVSQLALKLRQSLAQAAAGSEPMIAAFAALNQDADDLRRVGLDEALARVGRALAVSAGSAEAAAAAQVILGEAVGRSMNALRAFGEQGLDNTKASLISAGRVIDDEMVQRLAAANQALEVLNQRWTVFKGSVAAALIAPSRGQQVRDGIVADDKRRAGELDALANPASLAEAPANRAELQRRLETAQEPLPSDAYARLSFEQAARLDAFRAAEVKAIQDAFNQLANAEAELQKTAEAAAAKVREPIAKAQAEADAEIEARMIAQLDLATRIALAEDDRHRILQQMPDAEDDSLAAAEARLELTNQLNANDAELAALRVRQAATDKAAQAEDEAWLERMYAAEAERIALREKDRQRQRDQDLSRGIGASDRRIAELEASKLLLDSTRNRQISLELARQRDDIQTLIGELEQQPADPSRDMRIDSLRAQDASLAGGMVDLRPKDVGTGAQEGLVAYLNSIPGAAARAQQAVMGVAQAMEQGIGNSLRGLIDGTMTWTEALRNIGNAIVDAVLQSFVNMVAEWIVSHTIMAGIKQAFLAEDVAATVGAEGAKTVAVTAGEGTRVGAVAASTAASTGIVTAGAAAQTAATGPAAVFRSIMELGPIAGPLTFAAIIGGMLALVSSAAKGFATGGLVQGPGTGTSDSIFARLSNGEYVMPAATVQAYGVGFFDELRAGTFSPALGEGAAGSAGSGAVVVHNHFPTGVTRAEMAALIPEIERRVVASVRDRDRRGKI